MSQSSGRNEAVSVLASLLRPGDGPCPVLLLGAGASFRSGVPTAADAVRQIARIVYSQQVLRGSRPPERVRPSEWESWLQSFSWFIPGPDRIAENFPIVVEQLLVPADFRKKIMLELMRPVNGISSGYKIVAEFVMRGLIRTILTTNFDTCLPDALRERQPHIRRIDEVNRYRNDYDQFNIYSKCQVVWVHGRAEHYSDKNAAGEIGSLDDGLISRLRPMLDASPVIVVGYRGSELSVMDGLFRKTNDGRLDFPAGIFWCVRDGEAPHPNVESLARRLGSNFRLCRIEGFDEVFNELSKELAGQDRYDPAGMISPRRRDGCGFDEMVVETASLEDLDLDLAHSVLKEYCAKLGRASLTRETLIPLMREQALIITNGGKNEVTAGAILLFGKKPQRFFPQAVVSVTEAGKKREIYDDNLISQHRKLLEKLESFDVNPPLKVKKRRVHSDEVPYPPRVLVELLVNMLVHRDYAIPEKSSIEVQPGVEITFTNPGGLTSKLAGNLAVEADGRIVLSKGITDQRNPSLCDIFFGISAMERAGTGLMDVGQLMLTSGGKSAFYDSPVESRFTAVVAQARASAGSQSIARSDVPTGLYMLNVLPFAVVPEHISILRLKVPLDERPPSVVLSQAGTFVQRGGGIELWSFVPLPILLSIFEPIADKTGSASIPRRDIERSGDAKRIVSWLLRNHVEYHFLGFEDQGLILEEGAKHRAYFAGTRRGERTIVWNSAQRRGIKREVVKRRADAPRAWFENEGFGYEIVDLGGSWCLRIKPFYMFTDRDAVTPLPSFTRAAKATRRIKFDRNKSVEADLTFWAAFLSRGLETINVGDLHVDDLLINASFLTVEVPEIGLMKNEPELKNRMSA